MSVDILSQRYLPLLLPPRCEIDHRLRIGRGIESKNAAALADFLGDEILERGHLDRFVGDLVGEMGGDDDDAVAIPQNDVAWKHRRIAATDGHVDLDRLMQGEIGRRRRAMVIGGNAEPGDLGGVAKTSIGDDAGDAALHQPRHQDRAGRGRARVLAAVHHQHAACRAILDRLALRMGVIPEHVDGVEILARGHVAEREGLTDHGRLVRTEGVHILHHLDAQAALEQGGGDGGGGDGFELVAGGFAEFGHSMLSLIVIPGRAEREPGIHRAAVTAAQWIPGSSLRDAPE